MTEYLLQFGIPIVSFVGTVAVLKSEVRNLKEDIHRIETRLWNLATKGEYNGKI